MINPNNKIGVRELSDEQLKAGLPNYDVLCSRIDKIREDAGSVDRSVLMNETFETMKYDQIISILGGRGAGKTSVLYTIYKRIKTENSDAKYCHDIVLPIIMPELIEKNEGIISWLLAAMEESLCSMEKDLIEMKKKKSCNEEDNNGAFFDRCKCKKEKELRLSFDELKRAYYTQNYKFKSDSYSETREWKEKSVDSSYSLMKNFVEYWNTLIETKIKLNNFMDGMNKGYTPLIFIFIDDADLSPQIINELIYTLQKYLSHPNVVVFISASHKTLKYVVKNHMYQLITQDRFDLPALMGIEYNYNGKTQSEYEDNDTVRFHDLRYGREYDKINKLSDEILRKLFPVYNRFYLKKYEKYDEKKYLMVHKTNSNECDKPITLNCYVEELLSSFYIKVLRLHTNNIGLVNYETTKEPSRETIDNKIGNTSIIKLNRKIESDKDVSISKLLQLIKTEKDNELLQYCSFENDFYLSFFGIYPRDIMGILISLAEMLDELYLVLANIYDDLNQNSQNDKDKKISFEYIIKIREVLIKFLDSCTSSNRNLLLFSRKSRELIKTQVLHWQLFIDYGMVLELFSDPKYVAENSKNPTPFVEMICLLNFIEQIIVLIVPQRRSTHGNEWFSALMRESSIRIIKETDDLNEMFRQYYVFHSLNIIPQFKTDRIEHQFSFLYGVSSLGLLDNIKYKKDRMEYAEWYSIVIKVYFNRFNMISRLNRYKREFNSILKYSYLGKECVELCEDYKMTLEKIFFNGFQDGNNIASNRFIQREIPYDELEELDSLVNQFKVYFRSKDQLDNILDGLSNSYYSTYTLEITDMIRDIKKRRYYSITELIIMKSRVKKIINNVQLYEGVREVTLFRLLDVYLEKNANISATNMEKVIPRLKKVIDGTIQFAFYYKSVILKDIELDKKIIKEMPEYETIEKIFKYELAVLESETWKEFWGA